jgi:Uma2 family endonuclease
MGANEQPLLLPRHRLTVDEYARMAEVGVLAPDARTELIEGEVIDMAPQKSRHAYVVGELTTRLIEAAVRQARVTCQLPLRLSDCNEPEPDVMLLRPRDDGYARAHPGPADVLLLIEVADTSARYDREIKLPLYARHGVAEVWIIDLEAGLLRQYRQPADDSYASVESTASPATQSLPGLPGVAVDLSGLLA